MGEAAPLVARKIPSLSSAELSSDRRKQQARGLRVRRERHVSGRKAFKSLDESWLSRAHYMNNR